MKPLTPANPHAIVMVGIPGSGKSTFAEHFAETFQAPMLNLSSLQRRLGVSEQGLELLKGTLLPEYLKTHRTILIEGGVDRRAQRAELTRVLTKAGYQVLIVWVQTDTTEAHYRATKKQMAEAALSEEAFEAAVRNFQPPAPQEKTVVISGKHTYATQLKVVLKQIAASVDRTVSPAPTTASAHESLPEQSRPQSSQGRSIRIR